MTYKRKITEREYEYLQLQAGIKDESFEKYEQRCRAEENAIYETTDKIFLGYVFARKLIFVDDKPMMIMATFKKYMHPAAYDADADLITFEHFPVAQDKRYLEVCPEKWKTFVEDREATRLYNLTAEYEGEQI